MTSALAVANPVVDAHGLKYRRTRKKGWRRKTRGWKYILEHDYVVKTDLRLEKLGLVDNGFIRLDADGTLTIRKGYACDGPSGPTLDWYLPRFYTSFMRGAFVHDALYQLMREELISRRWKDAADQLLREHCIEDGMSSFRATVVYWGVRVGGSSSTVN